MKDYTVIYSENCVEACKRLIDEFILTFNVTGVHSDDLFYYGVFCKDITYANFQGWDDAPDDLEIPEIFKNPCATHTSREEYVRDIINQILLGEISKPAWMIYVEMEISVDGSMNLNDAHSIAEDVHNEIEQQFPKVKHIMIHVNPAKE